MDWFLEFRAEWFRRLRPFGSYVPWELQGLVNLDEAQDDNRYWGEGLIPDPPQLEARHLANCQIVPSREAMLELLPKGGVVAELGTDKGKWAKQILQIAKPSELHVIDLRILPEVRRDFSEVAEVQLHQADSATCLSEFPDNYFDWVYIDANHGYEAVKRDIKAATSRARLLVFNDYVRWSIRECEPYGVVAAVNELCLNDGWEIIYLALPRHMYCDVTLRKIDE